jgi:hypothetical protein
MVSLKVVERRGYPAASYVWPKTPPEDSPQCVSLLFLLSKFRRNPTASVLNAILQQAAFTRNVLFQSLILA